MSNLQRAAKRRIGISDDEPDAIGGKSMKPGGGGRFAKMVASGKSPALAAYIGRKKYGSKKMAQFSAKGRARS